MPTQDRKDKPDKTLERLLDGAQATFTERGYGAANIHEICARSKVGIGTFYAHFDDKSQLLQRVFLERVVLLSDILTVDDMLDHGRLVARLRQAIDDAGSAGLLRAWYEAVLDEPDIARAHAQWRPATLKTLAATIAKAQARSPSKGRRHDPALVSWAMATLAREMAIHDRGGAPDMDALARLFEALTFDPLSAT